MQVKASIAILGISLERCAAARDLLYDYAPALVATERDIRHAQRNRGWMLEVRKDSLDSRCQPRRRGFHATTLPTAPLSLVARSDSRRCMHGRLISRVASVARGGCVG